MTGDVAGGWPVKDAVWAAVVDDAATERKLKEDFLDYRGMVPMGVGGVVPQEHFERFGGVLPGSLLYAWRRFGFEGFSGGRFWITDPVVWEPVVEAWLDGIRGRLPFQDRWWCITRSAFGKMQMWGEQSGTSLMISPVYGLIYPEDLRADWDDLVVRERMGRIVFSTPVQDFEDDEGVEPAPAAIERLGPLAPGEVFGFVPPRSVTGRVLVGEATVQEAVPYLCWLAGVQDRVVMPDLISANRGLIDRIAAELLPGEEPGSVAGSGSESSSGGVSGSGGLADAEGGGPR
ncbi:MAG: GAD-like domain-containing protein [Pseudoclavibacter sp.]|nr:GAD-like domain-containing protein [Pseudoclavibacter sp.]